MSGNISEIWDVVSGIIKYVGGGGGILFLIKWYLDRRKVRPRIYAKLNDELMPIKNEPNSIVIRIPRDHVTLEFEIENISNESDSLIREIEFKAIGVYSHKLIIENHQCIFFVEEEDRTLEPFRSKKFTAIPNTQLGEELKEYWFQYCPVKI